MWLRRGASSHADRGTAVDAASWTVPVKWRITIEAPELADSEQRMLRSIVEGDERLLRLASPVDSEAEERSLLDNLAALLAKQFPSAVFRVVPVGENDED